MIAFIPARGGSTGVPKKNIKMLHGKPLILHTLEFAGSSGAFSKIIVSTDDCEIAIVASMGKVSRESFNQAPQGTYFSLDEQLHIHKRPINQAQTLSPIREVLFDLASQYSSLLDSEFLMMLQPTSPFRRFEELREIEGLMEQEPNFTSIVSVTSVGGHHPDRMYRLDHQKLKPYIDQLNRDNKPRQLLEELLIKDGAYYLLRKSVLKQKILLGEFMLPLFRSGLCTINIDTWTDFQMAELVLDPYTSNGNQNVSS